MISQADRLLSWALAGLFGLIVGHSAYRERDEACSRVPGIMGSTGTWRKESRELSERKRKKERAKHDEGQDYKTSSKDLHVPLADLI